MAISDKSIVITPRQQSRYDQIMICMKAEQSYTTTEIADMIGLAVSRTRVLLNELIDMQLVEATGQKRGRRYRKMK